MVPAFSPSEAKPRNVRDGEERPALGRAVTNRYRSRVSRPEYTANR
jgi:hypothetical protein